MSDNKTDTEYVLEEVQLLRRETRKYATVMLAIQIPPMPGQTFMLAWQTRMETAKMLIDKATEGLYE